MCQIIENEPHTGGPVPNLRDDDEPHPGSSTRAWRTSSMRADDGELRLIVRRPVEDERETQQFMSWIEPLRYDPRVRRDLDKYLRSVPKKAQLLEWADQQRAFTGSVLVVWAREDRLMPRAG